MVFFDGPHTTKAVAKETEFFVERASSGAVFVYDDINDYDHTQIENILFKSGFTLIRYGTNNTKASYLLS